MLISRQALVAVVLVLLHFSNAQAVVSFSFDTSGSPQPVPGASLAAANRAALTVSNALAAINPSWNATLDVQFHFNNLGSGVLGGATTIFPPTIPQQDGINRHQVAYSKILTNTDTNGTAKDIVIEMQALPNEANWYYGTNAAGIGNQQDDFESTMVHELVHSIGWGETMDQNGASSTGFNNWGTYDTFLGDGTSTFLNTTTFVLDATAFANNVTEGTGAIPPNGTGLYFHGAAAMSVNGGNPVPLYSPTTYSAGSSVSHVDTDFYTSDIFVMEHQAASGTTSRTIQPLEAAILRDIFTAVAIPEPSAFLFMGFVAALGGVFKYRSRRQVAASVSQ